MIHPVPSPFRLVSGIVACSLAFLAWGARSPARADPAASVVACPALAEAPARFQVAWVSPVRDRVRGNAWLDVVRVTDLRTLTRDLTRDQTRLLQALGILGSKGGGTFTPKRWKVTVFDIQADWLCRPVAGAAGGTPTGGIPACESRVQRGSDLATDCGYTGDSVSGSRGPDVYRIQWKDAARWGFCVMPLERFLAGA